MATNINSQEYLRLPTAEFQLCLHSALQSSPARKSAETSLLVVLFFAATAMQAIAVIEDFIEK